METLDGIRDIRLYQRKRGYRFSVDSLLLHHFVNLRSAGSIVDLGSGSGIVGLLLAKKYPKAKVTLLELQRGLHELALRNIVINALEDRVEALNLDIRRLPAGLVQSGQFDLAVSNPPFRRPLSGLLNEEPERAVARHEIELSLGELLGAAASLVKAKGRFCLVYHPVRLSELMDGLRAVRLEPKRLRFVHGNEHAEAKMVLVEAVKGALMGIKVERPLFIYNGGGGYTDEMVEIYGGGL